MTFNEREINLKIHSETKKYEILKKSFLKLYESETKASKSRRENFEKLVKIQENDNTELKNIYNLFTNEMKALEDKRNTHLNKIMDLILPVADYYPEKLKITKKNLEELSKVRKTKAKLEKSRNEVNNNNTDEAQRLNKELTKSRDDERKYGRNLENEICKFESERIEDNKLLFLHFIHSELKYHAACLEKMSELFYKIKEIDPRVELEVFKTRYKIDCDLLELYGIDIEKIQEDNNKKIKKEKEDIDDVYGSVSKSVKKSTKKSVKQSIKESQLSDNLENDDDDEIE